MDEFEVVKDPKLDDYYNQSLIAGTAFGEMIQQNGWKYVQAIIDATIKNFTNKALINGFKDMEEYAFERGIVEGQRKILGEIEAALKVVKENNARGTVGTSAASTSTIV